LFVDLEHLVRGSRRAEEAAEYVSAASDLLRSVQPTAGMFGRTDKAVNADVLWSQAREQHLQKLDQHHRSLRWTCSCSAEIATVFDEADNEDNAGASTTAGIRAVNEQA
jgi:hypothetical protein